MLEHHVLIFVIFLWGLNGKEFCFNLNIVSLFGKFCFNYFNVGLALWVLFNSSIDFLSLVLLPLKPQSKHINCTFKQLNKHFDVPSLLYNSININSPRFYQWLKIKTFVFQKRVEFQTRQKQHELWISNGRVLWEKIYKTCCFEMDFMRTLHETCSVVKFNTFGKFVFLGNRILGIWSSNFEFVSIFRFVCLKIIEKIVFCTFVQFIQVSSLINVTQK